uniref:F-actin monooxygenase n=1 Tax=Sinocyclocheilus rhinocerous TaxID=307959 RepID=A0A673GKP3_9TELE
MGEMEDERTSQAGQLFENFVQATTCKGTLQAFSVLCRQLELNPSDHRGFYSSLKAAVTYWKAKGLWGKLDKRVSHKEYSKGKACVDTRCLIIGGGPCGFRTAIELALLGAKVVVIEKRDTFSRNNVLHLWPYTIQDLRDLGAKKFYGKFCAGSIDHISIRQLQLMLLKIALIVGVEVHVNMEFAKLLEPPEDQGTDGPGWRVEVRPADHPISDYEFDVIIGADGRRSTLDGFKRKEFRGKLAIAITANFVNRNTTAEAKVEEISGVAFIFNQKFFLELKEETGIDLENIVYYKDNTHYFVMTAKKQSLLDKGVIINDYIETERLLASDNVNQEALLSYAREAADFGTNYQLPSLDYAINHYGQPDVAMFDFTCMYASENAALVREKSGHQLLVALVGDSLLEPFWPMGTGCARGFLAAFDTAWMIKGWAQGKGPLDLLSERESIYRLLPQTTAENISKNFEQYTIDPATRYPNLNSTCVRPHQVRHLYINGEQDLSSLERSGPTGRSVNISRRESEVRPSRLLLWCQKQTQGYRGVDVTDLTSSWRSGLALCALIHRQRPDLIDFDSLNETDCAKNNQLAFDMAEREFGIQPVTTGKEMNAERGPDKLIMVLYLSKFYEMFHNSPQSVAGRAFHTRTVGKVSSAIGVKAATLAILYETDHRPNNPFTLSLTSMRKEFPLGLGGSDICHFCKKRVYIMERLSAEGYFFHRECFRCNICGCTLRLGGHAFDSNQGLLFFNCCIHELILSFLKQLSPTKAATSTIESGCPLMEDKKSTPIEEIPKIPLYRTHFRPESPKPSTSSPEPVITADPSEANSLSPKKKLTLSLSEKEKLLNWDLATPGKPLTSGEEQRDRTSTSPPNDQPEPEAPPKPSRPQPEPTPPLLGFQQWANSLRKSFSTSKGNNTVVLRRNRPLKARPLSEGSFNLSGLFGSSIQSNRDEEHSNTSTDDSQSRVRTGSELTTLMEQVALSSKTHKGTKDDMASLPPRKLNFFSSLRIKRNEEADQRKGDNQKDILTILSRFRNIFQLLKVYCNWQVIQRQLEEVEEKQRALEEKGVALEKILRGETGDESTDETTLLQTWFKLVLEKNKLSRYESELMIFAQELELEDTQSRLQQDMRRRMATEGGFKSASELTEEQSLLVEIMKVVENRDKLVSLLEEQRLKEKAEDRDLESMILSRGYQFHWT